MKASDLMIGDWVKTQDVECAKVSFIDHYGDVGLDIDINKEVYSFPERDIIPIPLTEEILKENGFREVQASSRNKERYEYRISNDLYITVRPDDYGKTIFMRNSPSVITLEGVEYVHELQQALRLIGLGVIDEEFTMKGGEE